MAILDKMHIKNKKDENTDREYEDLGFGMKTTPASNDESVQHESNRQADNLPISKDGVFESYGEEDEALVDEIEARAVESYETTMYVSNGIDPISFDDEKEEE